MKHLQLVQATRRGHICTHCGKRGQGRMPALALIDQTRGGNGEIDKVITYFCNIDCFNDWEAKCKPIPEFSLY